MSLTEFEKSYKNTLLKLTDDIDEIYSTYVCLQTDKIRQKVIEQLYNEIKIIKSLKI